MKMTDGLSIGVLSERSGVNIETIRYYEKIGVMPAPARSAGGYRVYGAGHVKRLHFVRRGRELGFSLDKLRGLLHLVDGHAYTCSEVHALAVGHLKEIRQKIADLRRLERVMSDMAARCTTDQVPECPIIDALFEMRPVALTPPRDSRLAAISQPVKRRHSGRQQGAIAEVMVPATAALRLTCS